MARFVALMVLLVVLAGCTDTGLPAEARKILDEETGSVSIAKVKQATGIGDDLKDAWCITLTEPAERYTEWIALQMPNSTWLVDPDYDGSGSWLLGCSEGING